MQFSVLASGSTGNAIYVGTERTSLLVDVGLTGKQAEALLQEVGVKPNELQAILVTHEHSDHIKGVGVMARRYGIPVYTTEKTWGELDRLIGVVPESQRHLLEVGQTMEFGDITVQSFGTSHDAVEPMGFCMHHENKKMTIATDTGYVSDKMKEIIKGSDAYIFESNHDVDMLRMSAYPWSIKQRILSDFGHLSNEMAAEALLDILGGEAERVYLAHLSKENNMMDLAKLTVKNILEESGLRVGDDVYLRETYPHRPTRMEKL